MDKSDWFWLSFIAGVVMFLGVVFSIAGRASAKNDKLHGACRLRGYEAYDTDADACYKRTYEPKESR